MKAASNRVAFYARVSTAEGKQHLDNQLAKLDAFAAEKEWKVVAIFTDQLSGASANRPGLDDLMKCARRRDFDHVAVFDLSRLTRGGPSQAFSYINRLSDSHINFWSATEEHFRTGGPFGEVFIAIAAHIAAQERTTMRNRIKAGIDRARRLNKRLGRPRIVVDHSRIFELRNQGNSTRQIAKRLETSKSTIERILKRPK